MRQKQRNYMDNSQELEKAINDFRCICMYGHVDTCKCPACSILNAAKAQLNQLKQQSTKGGDVKMRPTVNREDLTSPEQSSGLVGAKRDWVKCPICGEPDMRKESDEDGNAIITCVNHACASNGGSNADALNKHPSVDEDKERLVELVAKAAAGWLLSDDDYESFCNDKTDSDGLKEKIRQAIDKAMKGEV